MKLLYPETDIASFLEQKPIVREYTHFSEENCPELEYFLASLLRSISFEFLLEILFTILNELLVNAFKANAKRIYFEKIQKDIHNPVDYEAGIIHFREEFNSYKHELIESLKRSHYRIRMKIQNGENSLRFWVTNTADLLDEERERIEFRIDTSSQVKNLSEIYHQTLDTNESSGLGIVLVKLLLKNSGIHDNHFRVDCRNGETTASFEIPKTILPITVKNKINTIIQYGVDGLPTFSEKIAELINIIQDPQSSIQTISSLIEREPAIAVEVLKLANSPIFLPSGTVSSLKEAIKRIGLGNIARILYAIGTKRIFNSSSPRIKEIWDHAYRTAFYSFRLADKRNPVARPDIAALGGLLHDLGRMILVTLDQSIVDILNQFRKDQIMNQSEFVEEISLGTSHTEIGKMLANRWNFPQDIGDCIEFHHRPWNSSPKNLAECETVYVADFMANMHRKAINFAILDPRILEKFGFSDIADLEKCEIGLDKEFSTTLLGKL